jgi:hypothetical protein
LKDVQSKTLVQSSANDSVAAKLREALEVQEDTHRDEITHIKKQFLAYKEEN